VTFLRRWASDWPRRLPDAALHVLAALLAPGPWWVQYLPDLLLPALWGHGAATGRFLPADSVLLRALRAAHLRGAWAAAGVAVYVALALALPVLVLPQVAVHLLIDLLTHEEGWL
jgi:hypothetical protein